MNNTILVTGAFGNIGCCVVRELLLQGYCVRAFDKDTRVNRKNCCRLFAQSNIEVAWGDIRDARSVTAAVKGVDAVIHLAGIIPPNSEKNRSITHAVNVEGTAHVANGLRHSGRGQRIISASSIAVYGKNQQPQAKILQANDPICPDDYYSESKAAAEALMTSSTLNWTILRIAGCVPVDVRHMGSFKGNPFLAQNPQCRLELVHPADAALAFVNAIGCRESFSKTLLLGGGETNRTTTFEMSSTMFTVFGLKPLPEEAFQVGGKVTVPGDWVDSTESEQLLRYQRHSCQSIFEDLKSSLGMGKYLLSTSKLFSPVLYWAMLRSSPYYRLSKAKGASAEFAD